MIRQTTIGDATEIPVLGLGCSRIGSFGNPTPMRELRALLDHAVDIGVTLFDTADVYGQGDSEREIGRLARRHPGRLFVMTKVGKRFSPKMRLLRPLKPLLKPLMGALGKGDAVTAQRRAMIGTAFEAGYLPGAVDASLRRLGTETIDALLLHSPSAAAIAGDGVAETLAGLARAGKVRRYGVSCDDLDAVRAALMVPGLSILQLPMPLIDELQAAGLEAAIRAAGITVFAREVLRHSDLPAPRALAEALARPIVDAAIVGTGSRAHLDALAAMCR